MVFFVRGFVDGETLNARLRRAGPLGPREGGKLIQERAWALGRDKAFTSDVAEIFSVRNGKIDSFAIYFDSAPRPR